MGFLPQSICSGRNGKKAIWVHAVSVGEVLAIQGLLKRLHDQYPEHRLVLSTVTQTGYRIAREGGARDGDGPETDL